MLVTLAGIEISGRRVQPEKVPRPMLVTPSGMLILVRPMQDMKATLLILVIVLGTDTLTIPA